METLIHTKPRGVIVMTIVGGDCVRVKTIKEEMFDGPPYAVFFASKSSTALRLV
jgi:hypothetical protein